MYRFSDYTRLSHRVVALIISLTGLAIVLYSAQPCFGASLKKNKPYPLIIMGGHWSAHSRTDYSDLSHVCDVGFTQVFSYYTEALLSTEVTVTGALNNAMEFAETVNKNCLGLGLAIGIPRRWIYEGRLDLIEGYVAGLNAKNVAVDYWFSDEMIHQMVREGIALKDAELKARDAINAVKRASDAPYIWIEPGNYNALTNSILGVLNDLPAGIKSYDEYVISRAGRLSESLAGFNGIINTLKRLKSKGSTVFPVCEINYVRNKNIAPLENELAAISISLLMEGADGLIFYEERWTTPETLQSLKKISSLIAFLNDVGAGNFARTKDILTTWEAKNNRRTIKTVLNTTGSNIAIGALLPERSVVVWPLSGKIEELKPMELLVFYFE